MIYPSLVMTFALMVNGGVINIWNTTKTPRVINKDSCCLYCNKRVVGCHSKCEDYKFFKEKIAEEKKDKLQNSEYWGYSTKVVERRLKEKERLMR